MKNVADVNEQYDHIHRDESGDPVYIGRRRSPTRAVSRDLLALGLWDGNRALLVRWNGYPGHMKGNPASHANPTWFVIPHDLHGATLGVIPEPNRSSGGSWLDGDEPTEWFDPVGND